MNAYEVWAARYPQAAAELQGLLTANSGQTGAGEEGKTETYSQQRARFNIAQQGALSWRNNVGATPAKCPDCNTPRQPVRYGLANDSARLNKELKSSDLILGIPRVIAPADVGKKFLQFGAVETKRPGWVYTGKGREAGQAAWLTLIASNGGFATFSTGEVQI